MSKKQVFIIYAYVLIIFIHPIIQKFKTVWPTQADDDLNFFDSTYHENTPTEISTFLYIFM